MKRPCLPLRAVQAPTTKILPTKCLNIAEPRIFCPPKILSAIRYLLLVVGWLSVFGMCPCDTNSLICWKEPPFSGMMQYLRTVQWNPCKGQYIHVRLSFRMMPTVELLLQLVSHSTLVVPFPSTCLPPQCSNVVIVDVDNGEVTCKDLETTLASLPRHAEETFKKRWGLGVVEGWLYAFRMLECGICL